MPSGELVGTTLKFTGREVTDGHSHFSNTFKRKNRQYSLGVEVVGAVDGRDGDDCKPYWSRVEIPTWIQFFFAIFCTNSYKRIHTIVIQIV